MLRSGSSLSSSLCRPAPIKSLWDIKSPVPLCADESCHTSADLDGLLGSYQFVSIKLDKAGGLTEALSLAENARNQGFGRFLSCMMATSLAMAPAAQLANIADYVDLDAPLLLARDRDPPIEFIGARMQPPSRQLLGLGLCRTAHHCNLRSFSRGLPSVDCSERYYRPPHFCTMGAVSDVVLFGSLSPTENVVPCYCDRPDRYTIADCDWRDLAEFEPIYWFAFDHSGSCLRWLGIWFRYGFVWWLCQPKSRAARWRQP